MLERISDYYDVDGYFGWDEFCTDLGRYIANRLDGRLMHTSKWNQLIAVAQDVRQTGEFIFQASFNPDENIVINDAAERIATSIQWTLDFFQPFHYQMGFNESDLERALSRLENEWDSVEPPEENDMSVMLTNEGNLELPELSVNLKMSPYAETIVQRIKSVMQEQNEKCYEAQDALWIRE